ncbi:hypothetical protein V1514DRAFT_334546 [Lipomyces japonicus]|uniref:uncharacterized protein n=1 Tax=Lipomyces japonicus TaxID=56871 RepID=UPI0034CEFB20
MNLYEPGMRSMMQSFSGSIDDRPNFSSQQHWQSEASSIPVEASIDSHRPPSLSENLSELEQDAEDDYDNSDNQYYGDQDASQDSPAQAAFSIHDDDADDNGGATANQDRASVLRREAKVMQDNLAAILERILKVKDEYEKLENENKFLQDYIGNLMSASNMLSRPSG